LVTLGAAVAVALAACSSDDDDDGAAETDAVTSLADASSTATARPATTNGSSPVEEVDRYTPLVMHVFRSRPGSSAPTARSIWSMSWD
jgi:hypothetical protein